MVYRLARSVRCSIEPFSPRPLRGYNPSDSIAMIQGLGLNLEVGLEVEGPLDPRTGFVLDVVRIDELIWHWVIPNLWDLVNNELCRGRSIHYQQLLKLIRICWLAVEDKIEAGRLVGLYLRPGPCRTIRMEHKMVLHTERFRFSAAHRLWNPNWTEAENRAAFGSCANPNGHGHNYALEVTVRVPDTEGFNPLDLTELVNQQVIVKLDHRNLNLDVPFFEAVNPTMEQIARFAWEALVGRLGPKLLHCVTVWESDRSCCSYLGR